MSTPAIQVIAGITAMCVCLIGGCAPTPKKMVQAIDASFATLSFKGIHDFSDVSSIENWPTDSLQNKALLAYFSQIGDAMRDELKKDAKKGRYTYADREDLADLTVELNFLKHAFAGKTLMVPVEVVVRDMRSQQMNRWSFTTFGENAANGTAGDDDYYFHLFGLYMAGIQRNFPYSQVGGLFYAH
ncbi:MAG: hypothetical protein A2268_16735 [Candidatus Raymondbacteria bacterium RifOxyA12_full_50_37]|uniref:DUF4136 domain-containing protein n=1 Tax=Candidatus Raymondbacteria bacterium RIFOXYD12_FULL_49_13 TaxID=1817890 RepID=A0A1F7F441_UNCRA|nr:MAG: hypothetical protein A2268_16735 [Candidatus Raymondbacteria bacterium RifOxyA12_full_50_37]OGJ86257.1 MAG: hypothetical protein A2248_16330 [Candidatus Raymondbacteria bacterium RIFOXYA2_FULL_49_16]OGJ95794.1 MAG: hypothetical protein A2453_11645 [Candidatus Raymondbacteria bacterium RIFOXYC2_FULL_50_21]OGJ96458.1 MAG: hypothetical protein A2350_04995 [Candidatus Raymondbacteria bacterium RifOxyB12_full_50_8]OGK01445.1 MAG: hypothetical protein A2519_19150 [Candidatus Raymondbacteria b